MVQNSKPNADPPPGTILESNDEIRRAQAALRQHGHDVGIRPERLFRPTVRPPIAILTVMDDGSSAGEHVRIRDGEFIIGRSEGDLKLPFDELLSSRHVAITQQVVSGAWRWVVTDLQSRNGVFFRVSRAPVVPNAEFLVGRGCYRLHIIQHAGPDTAVWDGAKRGSPATKAILADAQAGTEMLIEVVRGGDGSRTTLVNTAYSIGAGRSCDIVRTNDPFTAETHARLVRNENGTWMIENLSARNGVWLRLPQVGIVRGGTCEFQAGEQRFRLAFGARK